MTDQNNRPNRAGRSAAPPPAGARGRHPSTSPVGTSRTGRREADRRRHDPQPTALERFRRPVLALIVVAVIAGVSLFVFTSAAAPAYACGSIDTVQPAASGEIGQVQPDMGRDHVQSGEKVTYLVCPPASGKHVNKNGYGPLQPKVYGPDDQSAPNGWVHNLEHGGLVLLYSCTKGACDDASLAALRQFSTGFPASAVCGIPAGTVGPVVAKFDAMPMRFAALVWDRVVYLDTLDVQEIYDFYLRYGERVANDGTWIAPPEPQCAAPSPTPAASAAASPSPSGG